MEYVVIMYSTVNGENSSAMGPYSEEDALTVLCNIHQNYLSEMEDETYMEDYKGAVLEDENLDKGFFSVRWSESEFIIFTLCRLERSVCFGV